MDEDPTTAGGVGGGNAQNEPHQTTQTASTKNNSTDDSASTAPTISEHGVEPITFGGNAPQKINRKVDSNYVDRDLKLNTGEKKSHKTPLIVGTVIGVLLLVLGGFAFWFFAIYSNPDKVAFDAIENFLTAEDISMNGGFSLIPQDEDSPFELAILQLDSSSKSLPNSTSATLLITPKDAEENSAIQLNLGTVQLSDGIMYVEIGGIMDAIEAAGIDEILSAEILDLAEEIDNEWWQISVPDLLDHLETPADEADALNDIYSCAVDFISKDNYSRLAQAAGEIYRKNKFIEVTPVKTITDASGSGYMTPTSGYGYYEIRLNTAEFANFVNALPETSVAQEFYDCYNSAISSIDGADKISATDFAEVSSDDFEVPEDMHIYLEISKFDHQLRSIVIEQGTDDMAFSGSILFTYVAKATKEPEDYRPITDLLDEITELISQSYSLITIDAKDKDDDIDDWYVYEDDWEWEDDE